MAFGFAQPTSGLIADRVALPDRQHSFLLDFARAYADDVTVVVCGGADPAMANVGPAQAHADRIQQRFPGVAVVLAATDALPARAGTAPLPSPWLDRIAATLAPRRYDLLFAADATWRPLANRVGARFVPCFAEAPFAYASGASAVADAQSAPAALPLKRVCLFGPESTGKSTLAANLAAHYKSLYVPEYVRGYLDAVGSAGTAQDVPWIARGQRAAEAACMRQAERLLICDTNLATVALWSDVLFGGTPAWLRDEAAHNSYDLWLLTDIDVPFEPDPQRCYPEPEQRAWFMAHCRMTLARLGVTPVVLRGSPAQRLALAVAAIDRMLGQ